jgi:hypothetical protein
MTTIDRLALGAEWCDAAVEDVIASCDGNVMKALKVLLVAMSIWKWK